MTRLVEDDVRTLTARLGEVDAALRRATGLDVAGVAARAVGTGEGGARAALARAHVAVVPITSGQGVIPGFVECVAAICAHLGCDARITALSDVGGLAEAVGGGVDLVFAADDGRFLALNPRLGLSADNDPCTAWAYAAALDAACGGVAGKAVLVLGLGPVGRAAAARLVELGAQVLVAELDQARLDAVRDVLAVEAVTLAGGLVRARLVFDATPVPDLIDAGWVGDDAVVSAPGLPACVTEAARVALGDRLAHEPLALGVATMAVHALLGPRPLARSAAV
jgi:pyrrolysine biosynthesis protein PylD